MSLVCCCSGCCRVVYASCCNLRALRSERKVPEGFPRLTVARVFELRVEQRVVVVVEELQPCRVQFVGGEARQQVPERLNLLFVVLHRSRMAGFEDVQAPNVLNAQRHGSGGLAVLNSV